jgi:hypothetical protein
MLIGISNGLAQSDNRTGQAVFGPTLEELRNRTDVPLRLPAYVAADKGGSGLIRDYGVINKANYQNYEVFIAATSDCIGQTFCLKGIVTGQQVSSGQSLPPGESVTLVNGIAGRFVEATCGASCGMGMLFWKEGNYLYSVQMRAGPKDALLEMANSAIDENVAE